jgi:hypothetical protein
MTEPNEIEFREQVGGPGRRPTVVRAGMVVGAALLVVVGAVAAMGASPSPATGADPAASASPDASAAPGTIAPKSGHMGGFGMRGGEMGRGGFHDITITAVSGSDISLKTDDGWTRTITATSTTTITKGGATITVGALAVGDEIRFSQEKATDGTYTVTAIVVVLPSVAGEVSAISGDTLTITQPGGTTATIHVSGDTTYQVNGAAGTKSDIKVGSFIVAEGTQRTDGSLDAAAVRSGFGGHDGFRGPGGKGGHDWQSDPNASPAPSSSAG